MLRLTLPLCLLAAIVIAEEDPIDKKIRDLEKEIAQIEKEFKKARGAAQLEKARAERDKLHAERKRRADAKAAQPMPTFKPAKIPALDALITDAQKGDASARMQLQELANRIQQSMRRYQAQPAAQQVVQMGNQVIMINGARAFVGLGGARPTARPSASPAKSPTKPVAKPISEEESKRLAEIDLKDQEKRAAELEKRVIELTRQSMELEAKIAALRAKVAQAEAR
ncbi:MAG: hypothetical protein AAGD14_18490 [Planctomycetota bacterium]